MTDVKAAVERLRKDLELENCDDQTTEDICTVLDHLSGTEAKLEAVERKLVAMTVQGAMHMTNAEELEKERDKLRERLRMQEERLEAAERVILLAQRADTYSSEPQENERGETFYYTFDPYMSEMANAMNEYLIRYDARFGGSDET